MTYSKIGDVAEESALLNWCEEHNSSGYDAATIDHKDHLDIIGYQIYRYSNAKLARP